MGLICVKNGSISQKAKIWKILLHHNGIDEKNLMHNLKKIYLMMSDRLHDAVNDFSHPRSEDLSKVNQKSAQHREFKTIILGNRSVKTELNSKIMGANRKVWIPYLFGNAAIFCQNKNFQKLEASSKKINLALEPKKIFIMNKTFLPKNWMKNEKRKHKSTYHTGYSTFCFQTSFWRKFCCTYKRTPFSNK